MNLIPILSEQEYQKARQPSWPSYQQVIAGQSTNNLQDQQHISAVFAKGLTDYLEQNRSNEIAEGNRDTQNQIFFDKHVQGSPPYCKRPWQTLGVNSYGDVFICISPTWLPRFAGNLLAVSDIYNILNSAQARAIRNEILNNRYYYCNFDLCGFTRELTDNSFNTEPTTMSDLSALTFINSPHDAVVTEIPRNLIFDFDHTCNYRCPSCRTELLNYNKHPIIAPINQRIANKIKTLIIDEIRDQDIEIRWAGGEPFISKVYLELMEYIIQRHPKGNVKHCIQTNGSYLKAKESLLDGLLPHVNELRISFDAATADTYHKVRVNGVWDNLINNVQWLMQKIKTNDIKLRVAADFVVQRNNYHEIPEFKRLCTALGIDIVNYQKMWNWTTWSNEEFDAMNVYHHEHPEYFKVLELLKEVQWHHMPPERTQESHQ